MERAVEKGDFGKGPKTIIQNTNAGEKGAHFAASVEFFTVSCDGKEYKVVGKIQPPLEFTRMLMHSNEQFATEVLMYKEVVPFFGVRDLFPKLYYGNAEGDPEKDAVILEDMGAKGYKVTDEKLFLSADHLRLAVKSLGRFHAASIAAKALNREEFDKLVAGLKYVHWSDEEDTSVEQCMARGINPILDKHGDILKTALGIMQNKTFLGIVSKPREPWAVICHGDFCRNNMLFKYEGDKPVSVKFFDLQTSRYSSPAIDLSFFLYLNSDKATRDLHWDSLLEDYLDSLKSSLPAGVTISEKEFYDDFAARAVYGYYHCSFFSPMMILETPLEIENYSQLSLEERTELMTTMAGEKGTQLIVDIVEHLMEKKYIHKFVEFINSIKK